MGTTEQRSAEIAVTDLKLPLTVSEYLDRYNVLCREMLGRGSLLKGWFPIHTSISIYICSINYFITSILSVFKSLWHLVIDLFWRLEHVCEVFNLINSTLSSLLRMYLLFLF